MSFVTSKRNRSHSEIEWRDRNVLVVGRNVKLLNSCQEVSAPLDGKVKRSILISAVSR